MSELPPPPRRVFAELIALAGHSVGAVLCAIMLYGYLLAVEAHLVADRLAQERADFAPLRLDDAQRRDILMRSRAFVAARRSGAETTLRIGNDEVNEWLAVTGAPPSFTRGVRLRMDDDRLRVRLSLPMDDYGFPGRYLDGEIAGTLAFDEQGLALTLATIEIGGEPLPPRLWQVANLLAASARLLSRETVDDKLRRHLGRFRISDSHFVAQTRQ